MSSKLGKCTQALSYGGGAGESAAVFMFFLNLSLRLAVSYRFLPCSAKYGSKNLHDSEKM
jgi:hypothetical protein